MAQHIFNLVVARESRAQDADAAVEALAGQHGVALEGEYPAYRIASEGALEGALQALLVDLVYAAAIRNVTVGWHAGGDMPRESPLSSMQIDEFIAAGRAQLLKPDVWYRVFAPKGYRCRP